MRLNPEEIRAGLDELMTLPDVRERLGARWIIRQTKEYITQIEADLRRAGFTEYTDKETTE